MNVDLDIWLFLAGLGVFLFGMSLVELALRTLANRSFKKFLRNQTKNPLKGIFGGVLVTALLQSSSIVSLMVLAFVGAGILQLKNAIGIIFGSNLGSTFTGWIAVWLGFSVGIENFALPLVAIGGLSLMFFSKLEKLVETGRFLLGSGFLFLGIDFMKESVGDFAETFDISTFEALNHYWFFPIGLALAAIIRSSSAVMVIALSALNAGVIPIESAATMVVGSDIGTTVTALLGAIGGVPSKKRVAASHFLFNVLTGLLALALLYPLILFITEVLGVKDPLITLVSFHSLFNALGILLMLPFMNPFARFLENRFTQGPKQSARYIGYIPTDVPEAALEGLGKEIRHLLDRIFYMNITALNIEPALFTFSKDVKTETPGLFRASNYMENYAAVKQLEGEIVAYSLKIRNEKLDETESNLLNRSVQSVQNAMASLKEVKNIRHNVKEFVDSSNDAKHGLYLFLKGHLHEFYLSLHKLFLSPNNTSHFEQLADLLQENRQIHDKFLAELYAQIERKKLSDIEISTMLNVNREVLQANRFILLAIKDILLDNREAENFNSVSEQK
jgi:phosphate:Na+ symporter